MPFSQAHTAHFPLLLFIPLISGYTAVFYHYPPTADVGNLENLCYISKAQLKLKIQGLFLRSRATGSDVAQMMGGPWPRPPLAISPGVVVPLRLSPELCGSLFYFSQSYLAEYSRAKSYLFLALFADDWPTCSLTSCSALRNRH